MLILISVLLLLAMIFGWWAIPFMLAGMAIIGAFIDD